MDKKVSILFCTLAISNRLITPGKIFTLILVIMGCTISAMAQSFRPVSLLCEYQVNPIGMDIVKPSLSWLLEPTSPTLRGLKQTAYEVLVASSPGTLSNDKGDLWNSGLVSTDRNTQVIYGGKLLKSNTRYYWKVRVSDNEGKISKWSEVANWQTGLLNRDDWKGSWIGSKVLPDRKPRLK